MNYELFAYLNGVLIHSEYYASYAAAAAGYDALTAKYGDCYRAAVCVYCPQECRMYKEFRNY